MPTEHLENKAADGAPSTADVVAAYSEFNAQFEAYKQTNEQRLGEIESRVGPDPLTAEKMARIERAMDEQKKHNEQLTLKGLRSPLGASGAPVSLQAREHKAAWDMYMRRGETVGLSALEAKAMSVQSDPDGGYLVPDETEREIGRKLAQISPIRAIATVRQVSASVYKKPFATAGAATGWVGETAARPQTATPTLVELQYPTMELYAMPAASSTLLDDSVVNLEEWIAGEVMTVFAEQEGTAFVSGDGINKPRGFLDYPKVANASWSWGNLGYIATGVAGGFPASAASDKLIDLVYAVKSGYRGNAHWVMNRQTQSAIRKLKDADGNYLWQPAAQPRAEATLMGFPIAEAEDMPDVATDAHAIAFGDFARGYLVVDRLGVRVLRDPYTAKPYVLFYTTKRVGGGMQDFDAVKLLKFGVS